MSLTVEKCLQGWTNSLKQLNIKADIVFFGDSLTYYGEFSHVFPDKVVCNLGLKGDTIQGMIERVYQVKMLEPKKVFLMAGINDIASCSETAFVAHYDQLINTFFKSIPESELIIQSLTPVNDIDYSISCRHNQISCYNKAISHIASDYGLLFIDIYSVFENGGLLPKNETLDGIHLKSSAYSKWYDVLKTYNLVEL